MDGQRFDELARVLARGTSRRRVLKGLLGIGGGGALVALGAKGGPRIASAADTCQIGGSACETDDQCCAGAKCDQDRKRCYCSDPDFPGLGCPCDPATANPCGVGTLVCCADSNGGHTCYSVAAGGCPPPPCTANGDKCSADGDCCSGHCCGGTCSADVCPPPCTATGDKCSADGDCCSGHCCDGTCSDSACQCVVAGDKCSSNSDCCSGKCSSDGVCYCEDPDRPLVGCACTTGTEDPCGDSSLVCCPTTDQPGGPGVCTPGSVGCNPTQCAEDGDSCSADGDCCSGHCCDGKCHKKACPAPPKPVTPVKPVTVLPSTGSGHVSGGNDWVTTAAVVGAGAALVTAVKRRAKTQEQETESEF